MEIFINKVTTKNKIDVFVVGICEKGFKHKVLENLENMAKTYELEKTTDIFYIDYNLMNFLIKNPLKETIAIGASVKFSNVDLRTGGILGNPFQEPTSADGDFEKINENLGMLTFPGRVGVIFSLERNNYIEIKEYIESLLNNHNHVIVKNAVSFLKTKTDLFVLVSDGSGEGSFQYVCGYEMGVLKELF